MLEKPDKTRKILLSLYVFIGIILYHFVVFHLVMTSCLDRPTRILCVFVVVTFTLRVCISLNQSPNALGQEIPDRFAVVIDAGSTGSRAHVFRWLYDRKGCNGSGAVRVVLPEQNAKTRPGITTYLDSKATEFNAATTLKKMDQGGMSSTKSSTHEKFNTTEALVHYLRIVKDEIDKMVPKNKRESTPMWFLGTAGMRHLKDQEKEEMLNIIENEITQWGYIVAPGWVDILDGNLTSASRILVSCIETTRGVFFSSS